MKKRRKDLAQTEPTIVIRQWPSIGAGIPNGQRERNRIEDKKNNNKKKRRIKVKHLNKR